MRLTALIAPAAVLAAMMVAAVPAQAQRRDQNRDGAVPQNDRGQAVQRAPSNDRGRTEASRQAPAEANRPYPIDRVRMETPRQAPAHSNRQYSIDRGAEAPRQGPASANGQFRGAPRALAVPREVPRSERYDRPRSVIVESGRSYGYRDGYRSYDYPPYSYRPYAYTFRPRFRVGVGIYLGYPVPYPVYDPYPYPAPVYGYPGPDPGYPAPWTVTAEPGSAAYGGVSLEISPSNATVDIDGNYAGFVDDFSDPSRPLSLAAGRHHIQLQAPGYEPMGFDVDVVPGQVIPYRGDLQRF